MTETVADPAKSQIIGSVHWLGGRAGLALGVDDLGCRKTAMNTSRPATATTLATNGAHAKAPNGSWR